jgi:hypothetical protein
MYKKEKDICLVGIERGPPYLFKVVAKSFVVARILNVLCR